MCDAVLPRRRPQGRPKRALGGKRRSSAAELDECLPSLHPAQLVSVAAYIDARSPSPMSGGSVPWPGGHCVTVVHGRNFAPPMLVLQLASFYVRQSLRP
jgi:hypothetical protein